MNKEIKGINKARYNESKKFYASVQDDCNRCLGYLSEYLHKQVRVSPSSLIGGEENENYINVQIFTNETDYSCISIPYTKITENKDLGFNESVLKGLTEILVQYPERVSKYKASYVEKLLYTYINSLGEFCYWINNDDGTLCYQADDNTELICFTEEIHAIGFEVDGVAKIYLTDDGVVDFDEDFEYILLRPEGYELVKINEGENLKEQEKAQNEAWMKICEEDAEAEQKRIERIIAIKYPNKCPKCGAKLVLEPNAPHIDDTEYIVCTNFNCNWAEEFNEEIDEYAKDMEKEVALIEVQYAEDLAKLRAEADASDLSLLNASEKLPKRLLNQQGINLFKSFMENEDYDILNHLNIPKMPEIAFKR